MNRNWKQKKKNKIKNQIIHWSRMQNKCKFLEIVLNHVYYLDCKHCTKIKAENARSIFIYLYFNWFLFCVNYFPALFIVLGITSSELINSEFLLAALISLLFNWYVLEYGFLIEIGCLFIAVNKNAFISASYGIKQKQKIYSFFSLHRWKSFKINSLNLLLLQNTALQVSLAQHNNNEQIKWTPKQSLII